MSLENMKLRIQYHGGNQQERMNKDKLKSLRKALIYSYQAATAKLADGREFRCLINRNKLSLDLDDKIISIPFEDVCLNQDKIGTTTEGMVEIGMKEGDVFEWKENGSHWIVFLRRLEETAYFRADIRRCRYEIALDNGSKYWGYIRGPVEQQILWSQASGDYYNKLNYTLIMYLPQTEETLDYFHRFSRVTIAGRPWEVQAVDDLSTPGLIQIHLKETYKNTIENDIEKAVKESINIDVVDEKEETYIHGATEVYPYDVKTYEIKNYQWKAGTWSVENESRAGAVKLSDITDKQVTVNIMTGRSGSFTLVYKADDQVIAALDVNINSL
jgi:hypothetical protein